jgi:hypothetical protein
MKGLVCGDYGVYAQKSSVTRVINVGRRHFTKGDDVVFLHIYCNPLASADSIIVTYANKTPMYTLRITGEPPRETLQLDGRTFESYPTHQVERLKGQSIVYLTLENNRISFNDDDTAPLIEPHIDLQTCVVPGVKFTQLPFLPLHPDDPLLEGRWLHELPQRVPTWYVARGERDVSGSNVNKYAGGYWLDDDKGAWNARSSALMRFGRLNENNVQLIAMYNHQMWEFQECGTFVFPDPAAPPRGRGKEEEEGQRKRQRVDLPLPPPQAAVKAGVPSDAAMEAVRFKASPDCLAIVPSIRDWSSFPAATTAAYSDCASAQKMVLEFKASYSSTAFPEYYIPQLYWEMIATGSAQACLVRYKKRRQMDPSSGRWVTHHEAMEYHIFRDPVVEQLIWRNVRLSLNARIPLKDWVAANPQPYQELQHVLKQIVQQCKGRPLRIPKELLEKAYKERQRYV